MGVEIEYVNTLLPDFLSVDSMLFNAAFFGIPFLGLGTIFFLLLSDIRKKIKIPLAAALSVFTVLGASFLVVGMNQERAQAKETIQTIEEHYDVTFYQFDDLLADSLGSFDKGAQFTDQDKDYYSAYGITAEYEGRRYDQIHFVTTEKDTENNTSTITLMIEEELTEDESSPEEGYTEFSSTATGSDNLDEPSEDVVGVESFINDSKSHVENAIAQIESHYDVNVVTELHRYNTDFYKRDDENELEVRFIHDDTPYLGTILAFDRNPENEAAHYALLLTHTELNTPKVEFSEEVIERGNVVAEETISELNEFPTE